MVSFLVRFFMATAFCIVAKRENKFLFASSRFPNETREQQVALRPVAGIKIDVGAKPQAQSGLGYGVLQFPSQRRGAVFGGNRLGPLFFRHLPGGGADQADIESTEGATDTPVDDDIVAGGAINS